MPITLPVKMSKNLPVGVLTFGRPLRSRRWAGRDLQKPAE
jgi:hypothetical protein